MTRRRRGFTLLEVVVAMAMLALGLMAIFDLNSRAVSLHSYGKKLTVATLLARGQMVEIEQTLIDDGFPGEDDEETGDFSEEGWPSFQWRARILKPDTTGVSPAEILGSVLGLPVPEGMEGDPLSLFNQFINPNPDPNQPMQLPPQAQAMTGVMQGQITQFVEQITERIRQVELTVYWQEGDQVEEVSLVTHVISTGEDSDRNPLNPVQGAGGGG